MVWDKDADHLLIKLWDEGGSLALVAEGMCAAGYNVTRNAIAGRRHRLSKSAFVREGVPINTVKPATVKPSRTKSRMTKKIPPRTPVTIGELEELRAREGVEYLNNTSVGCKAILDRRGGDWKLPMVCGEPRGFDYNGCESPYCPTHFRLYTNPQAAARRVHG
jgi:hypothetical protein